MKKKILAVALTAIMALGSVVSAFADKSPNGSDAEVDTSSSDTEVGTNGSSTEDETKVDSPDGPNAEVGAVETLDEAKVAEIAQSAKVEGVAAGVKLEVKAVAAAEVKAVETAVEKVAALKGKALKVLDLKLTNGVQPGKDGAKVTLKADDLVPAGSKYVLVYVLEAGVLNFVDGVAVANGEFTFTAKHFSTYVFAGATEAEVEAAKKANEPSDPVQQPTDGKTDGGKGQTGDTFNAIPLVVLAVVAVGGVLVVSLKKKNA